MYMYVYMYMCMCPFLIYCKKVHAFPRGATQFKGFIIHADSLVGDILGSSWEEGIMCY